MKIDGLESGEHYLKITHILTIHLQFTSSYTKESDSDDVDTQLNL